MKFKGFVLILLCLLVAAARSELEEQIEEALLRDPECRGSKTIQCGRACGEYYVCANGPKPLSINRCPSSTPFCNITPIGDFCGTHRDLSRLTCQPLSFLFHCTDDGYYPDPTDCSSYYICVPFMGRWNAERHTCPRNYVYNSRLRRCDVLSTSNPCNTVSCEAGNSTFLAHPSNAQYFYNCVERSVRVPSGKIPVMHRCTSGVSGTALAFNEATQRCGLFTCSYNSRLAVQDNLSEFFQCNYNAEAVLEYCPEGYRFVSGSVCRKAF